MTSVDELVRRVVTVINSNDPVARALTLRVLGAIAAIIPERAAVHHKVGASKRTELLVLKREVASLTTYR